jgi:hypothetical protein
MSRNEASLGVVAAALLLGLWLMSNPQCCRGCQTFAEHLLRHALNKFFRGLSS